MRVFFPDYGPDLLAVRVTHAATEIDRRQLLQPEGDVLGCLFVLPASEDTLFSLICPSVCLDLHGILKLLGRRNGPLP